MAHKKIVLLASLLLAATALAQTADSKASIDLTRDDQIITVLRRPVLLARCAYSQTGEGCPSTTPTSDAGTKNTLAQMPRRMGPMAGRQGPPMGGPVYPETWGPQFSPGHALIGAAIGFGFGAAAGSKNGFRSSLAVGTLVGLVGAAIGASMPSFPSRYRRRGWEDDEDASRRKPQLAKPSPSRPDSAAQVAASGKQATETYQNNDFSRRSGTPNRHRRIS